MEAIAWLALFIVLLIIEIFTLGLTTIWFAGGALVSWILALLHVSLPIQIIVFVVVSVALFVLTRPLAMKYFNQKVERTNAERVIGKKAVVMEAIDSVRGTGRVMVDGMEWSAKAEEFIEQDCVVTITGIQGVKVTVKKEEE